MRCPLPVAKFQLADSFSASATILLAMQITTWRWQSKHISSLDAPSNGASLRVLLPDADRFRFRDARRSGVGAGSTLHSDVDTHEMKRTARSLDLANVGILGTKTEASFVSRGPARRVPSRTTACIFALVARGKRILSNGGTSVAGDARSPAAGETRRGPAAGKRFPAKRPQQKYCRGRLPEWLRAASTKLRARRGTKTQEDFGEKESEA